MKLSIDVPLIVAQYNRKNTKAAMRSAGGEVAATAKALIRRSTGKGKGKRNVSLPGEPPVSHTGKLISGMKTQVSRSGMSVKVADYREYATILEAGALGGGGVAGIKSMLGVKGLGASIRKNHKSGTIATPTTGRVLLPRPFLSRALEERGPSIQTRLKTAIMNDMKFAREKP